MAAGHRRLGRPRRRRKATAYLNELEAICRGCEFVDTGGPPWLPHERDPDNLALVDTTIVFPNADARLRVTEDIDMRIDPRDPRAEYIYELVVNGQPVLGYHRQPGEQWPDHGHDYRFPRHHPRHVFPATMTFAEVLEGARLRVYGAR